MKRSLFKKSIMLLIALLFVFSLVGCNTEEFKKNEQYVSDVKNLVNESVNHTRKLRELDKDFVISDKDLINEYLETTDSLMEVFEQIQKLQATDEFDDKDKELKEAVKNELTVISQLRNLVYHAQENGDDDIYQREKDIYFEEYNKNYEKTIDLSSEIQTYWRNA